MKKKIDNYFKLKKFEQLTILFGILGLIPFIIGIIDLYCNSPNLLLVINIPKNYGVIIFTFLGSIYWGIIIKSKQRDGLSNKFKFFTIIWSIIPSIFGFIILVISQSFSIIILAFGFIILHIIDEFYNNILSFPQWYVILRRALSLIVITILICSYLIITKL